SRAGAPQHPREPQFSVPLRGATGHRGAGHGIPPHRRGAGLASVVFPVEQHPGRRAPEHRGEEDAAQSGRPRPAREADARRSLRAHRRGQRLHPRSASGFRPSPELLLRFDDHLRQAFENETSLFFDSIVRGDRSVLDLLDADYTFLNERLARHYGIAGVYGERFRRVTLPPDSARRGLLGQGSILTDTSRANRTSPVIRGKWILENIFGTPPPSPPANVPELKDERDPAKVLPMREQMARHRANPVCASCHAQM